MGRSPLSIDITPKDKKELVNLLRGVRQQVRVVLRALALLQLANGKSAPLISDTISVTPQSSRKIGHRYQDGGLERALYEKQRPGAAEDYIAKMEDTLETYEPVVCLDEKSVTLHADVRPASSAKPGREARRDNSAG